MLLTAWWPLGKQGPADILCIRLPYEHVLKARSEISEGSMELPSRGADIKKHGIHYTCVESGG